MVTSGLVVQLAPDCSTREAVVAELRSRPAFTLGEVGATGLAVALEATDAAESERWLDWLHRLPGVVGAEVVFVHWEATEVTGA